MALFNRSAAPYFKGIFSGKTITVDFDEANSDITLIKKADMVVASTEIISTRYITSKNQHVWLNKELGYNAAGDLLYAKKLDHTVAAPSWAPAGVL